MGSFSSQQKPVDSWLDKHDQTTQILFHLCRLVPLSTTKDVIKSSCFRGLPSNLRVWGPAEADIRQVERNTITCTKHYGNTGGGGGMTGPNREPGRHGQRIWVCTRVLEKGYRGKKEAMPLRQRRWRNRQPSRVGERTGRLAGDPDARLNVYFTLVHCNDTFWAKSQYLCF